MKSFWRSWPRLAQLLASHKKKLLILDFDGTLTPIVKQPAAAELSERVRKKIKMLGRRRDIRLAVISGRSLKDLRARVRVPGLIYFGNHGLEVSGLGLRPAPGARRARRRVPLIRQLARKLRSVFYFWTGVTVEDKKYTLSLHFRNLRPGRKEAFAAVVQFYRNRFRKMPITWRKGKKVWEVRPQPDWGKGDAVKDLIRKFPGRLPIAVGDDGTDEDMFRCLRKTGITVRVGRAKKTEAEFGVPSHKDVEKFLEILCR